MSFCPFLTALEPADKSRASDALSARALRCAPDGESAAMSSDHPMRVVARARCLRARSLPRPMVPTPLNEIESAAVGARPCEAERVVDEIDDLPLLVPEHLAR